jgi:hypothetical protein
VTDVARGRFLENWVVTGTDQENCTLRLIAEEMIEACPRERCAFWECGSRAVEAHCFIERLGVDVRRPDLAAYLLETRERLDRARDLADAEQRHREFSRRVGYEF